MTSRIDKISNAVAQNNLAFSEVMGEIIRSNIAAQEGGQLVSVPVEALGGFFKMKFANPDTAVDSFITHTYSHWDKIRENNEKDMKEIIKNIMNTESSNEIFGFAKEMVMNLIGKLKNVEEMKITEDQKITIFEILKRNVRLSLTFIHLMRKKKDDTFMEDDIDFEEECLKWDLKL